MIAQRRRRSEPRRHSPSGADERRATAIGPLRGLLAGLARLREPRRADAAVSTPGRWQRLRLRLLAVVVVVAALLGGAWLWLRDSSLVAVRHVTITGVAASDRDQIRHALTAAARNMTTLDVQLGQLRTAVAPYPVVKALRVSTSFPHTLRIRVLERLPVAVVVAGGRSVAVAGDGTLLRDVPAGGPLPRISLTVLPGGLRLGPPEARAEVSLLGAAPRRILTVISQVTTAPAYGLVAALRNGPSIYFGTATSLKSKWTAAIAVLADPGSAGAAYIDVTDPNRPAAGAGSGDGGAATAAGASGQAGASAG